MSRLLKAAGGPILCAPPWGIAPTGLGPKKDPVFRGGVRNAYVAPFKPQFLTNRYLETAKKVKKRGPLIGKSEKLDWRSRRKTG